MAYTNEMRGVRSEFPLTFFFHPPTSILLLWLFYLTLQKMYFSEDSNLKWLNFINDENVLVRFDPTPLPPDSLPEECPSINLRECPGDVDLDRFVRFPIRVECQVFVIFG